MLEFRQQPGDRETQAGAAMGPASSTVDPVEQVQQNLPGAARIPDRVDRAVTSARRRATCGCGVLEAAIPAPMAGCITKNGATRVTRATISAGSKVGRRAQSSPQVASNSAAT